MPDHKPKNIVKYFIDTNILVRFFTQDGPLAQQEQSRAVIQALQEQKILGLTHSLMFHEAIYVLQQVYDQPKQKIVPLLIVFLELPNVQVADLEKNWLIEALQAYQKHNLDFPDCIFAVLAQQNNLDLLSFDRDFKKLGIEPITKIP